MGFNKDNSPRIIQEQPFVVVPKDIKLRIDSEKAVDLMSHIGITNIPSYTIVIKPGIERLADGRLVYGRFNDPSRRISIYADSIWTGIEEDYWEACSGGRGQVDEIDQAVVGIYSSMQADHTFAHELRHAKQSNFYDKNPRLEAALWAGTAIGIGWAVNRLMAKSGSRALRQALSIGAAAASLVAFPQLSNRITNGRMARREADAQKFEEEFWSLSEFKNIFDFQTLKK